MGSGSFGGGGGGGGGGWGGGGSPVIHTPMIKFTSGGARIAGAGGANAVAQTMIGESIGKVSKFGRPFATRLLCSPLTAGAYGALFSFSVVAFQNRDWALIEQDYKIGPGPGCLSALANAIVDRAAQNESDTRVRGIVQVCLADFFVRALGDDLKKFLFGDADAVLRKLNKKVFDGTSGHFLGILLWHMIENGLERPPADLLGPLRSTTQEVANRVIEVFQRDFLNKDGIVYRDLFRVICANQQWFFDLLRDAAKGK